MVLFHGLTLWSLRETRAGNWGPCVEHGVARELPVNWDEGREKQSKDSPHPVGKVRRQEGVLDPSEFEKKG